MGLKENRVWVKVVEGTYKGRYGLYYKNSYKPVSGDIVWHSKEGIYPCCAAIPLKSVVEISKAEYDSIQV